MITNAIHMLKILFTLTLMSVTFVSWSQDFAQTIRGRIVDKQTRMPVVGANVYLPGSDPVTGTISDGEGYFRLEKVALGRHTLQVSCVGYNSVMLPNIVVTSSKEVVLEISIEEMVNRLDEIVVSARQKKILLTGWLPSVPGLLQWRKPAGLQEL